MEAVKFLPGRGRGTMRSMVEGGLLLTTSVGAQPPAPSTAFGGPPPRTGEERI